MVLLSSTVPSVAATPCELQMESGRIIRYVAPAEANPRKATRSCYEEHHVIPSKSEYHSQRDDMIEGWEGVNTLCQTLDSIVEFEMETDLFDGKRVLEIGFATGLPSVFAFENGAKELAVHCATKSDMELYCKPTLRRNNVPEKRSKCSNGDLNELKRNIGGKKFDIILAPEVLHCNSEDFQLLHDIIDGALTNDGVCLISCRMYYLNVDGCLPQFLEVVKMNRKFDTHERWSSPRHDIIPRKVIQLTRSLF